MEPIIRKGPSVYSVNSFSFYGTIWVCIWNVLFAKSKMLWDGVGGGGVMGEGWWINVLRYCTKDVIFKDKIEKYSRFYSTF